MTVITLDQVVNNFIMRRKYTIHFWMEFMVYAAACLRELSMDDLKCVNTKKLTVNQNTNAADLPNDYLDYCNVGVEAGQNVKPLVETDKINPLVARTSNFTPTTYSESASEMTNQIFYGTLYPFYYNTVYWNDYGEPMGRLFGLGAGVQDDVFSVFPERGQIQLTERIDVDHIILEYISDGTNADAATKITPYAYETISAYIMWQMKENTRTYNEGEKERAKQEYISQRQILRARLSDLTTERLKRLLQRATYGAPKSI